MLHIAYFLDKLEDQQSDFMTRKLLSVSVMCSPETYGGRVDEWIKPLSLCSMVALISVGLIPALARFVMAVFFDSLQ